MPKQSLDHNDSTLLPAMLTPQSCISLYPLAVRADDDHYIAGRATTGVFIAVPEEGKRILELLQQGRPIQAIERVFRQENDTEVAVEDFITSLIELGFVQAIDGRPLQA